MKDIFEKLAAAIIYSDGEVATSELIHLDKLAAELGADKVSTVKSIEAEIEKLKPMDEEEFQQYMKDASAGLSAVEQRYKAFDAMLELTLADKFIGRFGNQCIGQHGTLFGNSSALLCQ